MLNLNTRLVAAVAAFAVTFTVIDRIANYAYPVAAPAMVLAAAQQAATSNAR